MKQLPLCKLNFFLVAIGTLCTLAACSNGTQFGLPSTSQEINHAVAYNNKVDIVLIVDNSSSMNTFQENLLKQMPLMVVALKQLKMDYHFAVITTSVEEKNNGGIFIGTPTYLKNESANLDTELQKRIRIGSEGSNLTRPLMNLTNIIFSSYMNFQGAGFLRSDALLALITLSDDDDGSTLSTDDFIDKMNTLKPDFQSGSKAWLYNFIGILSLENGCRNEMGAVTTVGIKHMAIADYTGGTKSTICGVSLVDAVANIKARIVQVLTDYKLKSKPKIETIRVSINGQVIANNAVNGWTYEADINSVRFHGTAIPVSDVLIVITFDPSQAN